MELTTKCSGKVKFDIERLEEICNLGEALPLYHANQKETGWNPDLDIDPDYEAHFRMERRGALKFFTVRTESGKLIGYSMFVFSRDLRVKTTLRADQIMTYIEPAHRGIGLKFFLWCDDALSRMGADMIWRQMPPGKKYFKAFQKMGYDFKEFVFAKEV